MLDADSQPGTRFRVGEPLRVEISYRFTRPLPTALTLVSMIASIGLLGLATKTLPIGTAYGVWVGIGAVLRGLPELA